MSKFMLPIGQAGGLEPGYELSMSKFMLPIGQAGGLEPGSELDVQIYAVDWPSRGSRTWL